MDIKKSWEWNDGNTKNIDFEGINAAGSNNGNREILINVEGVNIGLSADDDNEDVRDSEVESLALQRRATKWILAGG